jgi:hypothetical protein
MHSAETDRLHIQQRDPATVSAEFADQIVDELPLPLPLPGKVRLYGAGLSVSRFSVASTGPPVGKVIADFGSRFWVRFRW